MSKLARSQELSLSRQHLRFSTSFETVASELDRKLRRKEMAYRLGLDLLLQEIHKERKYRSFPSVPKKWIMGDFEGFVHLMAEHHSLQLPFSWNPGVYEEAGREKAFIARALSMVRAPFRRAIEVWLNMDRALWVLEQNRRVRLGIFCSTEISPRNVLILSA